MTPLRCDGWLNPHSNNRLRPEFEPGPLLKRAFLFRFVNLVLPPGSTALPQAWHHPPPEGSDAPVRMRNFFGGNSRPNGALVNEAHSGKAERAVLAEFSERLEAKSRYANEAPKVLFNHNVSAEKLTKETCSGRSLSNTNHI